MARSLFLFIMLTLGGTLAAAPVRLPHGHAQPPPSSTPRVVVETNLGDIVIELYADKAPITVNNFLQYVDEKHYDNTLFHRVIPNFMIQGGGFVPGLKEKKTREPIKNEGKNGLKNERGSIAMARTANPDSATAQFFINVVNNRSLDPGGLDPHGYCVFGKVVSGMDVVDRIAQAPAGQQGGHGDVPMPDVVIRSMRRVTK